MASSAFNNNREYVFVYFPLISFIASLPILKIGAYSCIFTRKIYTMKRIIATEKAPAAIGPYSQAVEVNGTLYISGQVPLDPATMKVVEGGITEQTEQVMRNIGEVLKEAGYSFSDVVKSTCLLSDMANFKAMNEVYGKYYSETPPARAAFAVKELPLGVMIEIETIAVK
jgi:2-iminobutanoate/2-iminopropanoate deaminase